MSAGPWYASGLRFTCRRCGACCAGSPGYVWLHGDEAARIASRLEMEYDVFIERCTRPVDDALSLTEEADGRCVLFESGVGCRAYEARPRQCRTWPFWGRIVATPAAWKRESADCPGMNVGELTPAEEIERLSRSPE